MDLSMCTPGQREIIATLDAPLMVAAGAGSGKTFTLTQRVVNARCAAGEGRAFLDSVSQVCAITFTKKAAAELRSRIKRKLVDEGFDEDALAVDSAWITTIHGMASRMLREHALEMGIDPAFRVISESEEKELLEQAANQVAAEVVQDSDYLMKELLANRPMFGAGMGEGVVDRALKLLNRVHAMPAGFSGLVTLDPQSEPSQIMRSLYAAGCDFKDVAASWKKPGKRELEYLDALDVALGLAQDWLMDHHPQGFLEEGFDASAFARAFYSFPPTSASFHAKKPDAGFFEDYRSLYACLSRQVEAAIGCREAKALVRFAGLVSNRYRNLKGPDRLDNGDLLNRCVDTLRLNPAIADSYRNMFKLIMIDEFQDTDKLQVELISMIAQPKLANVCVVGDAQQSIYRFRGADVNVFFEYRESLSDANESARKVSLPDNFRSHADVLRVVDAVFSQQSCFGDDFLRLEAKGTVNVQVDAMFQEMSRVNLDVVHYKRPYRGQGGVSKAEAVRVSARHIAEHFAALRRRGARASDMALLLGGMSNADAYAQALREAGFESVVSGGSVFAQSPEAQLVGYLLRFAVNAGDEQALFAVLTSPLFNLSDDVFVSLVSGRDDDGNLVRRSLSKGFSGFSNEEARGLSDEDKDAFLHGRELLSHFARQSQRGDVVRALRCLFLDSGLLDRLEMQGASGLASAGNYAKALSLLERFRQESSGISSIANAYAQHLQNAKEAPGGLSTAKTDVVQIMTVHASKGLEFPHVAVADLKTGERSGGSLLVENLGDNTYFAVRGCLKKDAKAIADKVRGFASQEDDLSLGQAADAAELCCALQEYVAAQTRAEAQRLLYVALTRASQSLLLCHCTSSNPEDAYASEGIYRDVYQALQWDTATQRSVSMCEYGGSSPACVRFEYISSADDARADSESSRHGWLDPAAMGAGGEGSSKGESDSAPLSCGRCLGEAFVAEGFSVPVRRIVPEAVLVPCSGDRSDVRSYTSLHHETPLQDRADRFGKEGVSTALIEELAIGGSAARDQDDATALGSAFHVLAQRSIEMRNRVGSGFFPPPSEEAIASQVKRLQVSSEQENRLRSALDAWFQSDAAKDLASFRHVQAEVPFMVLVGEGSKAFYLEGEIDALAHNDDGRAYFVDYKTGGRASDHPSLLRDKHRLQAQCYAYALMSEGFESVRAVFVRVEHPDAVSGGKVQTIEYEFSHSDLPDLEEAICAAAR